MSNNEALIRWHWTPRSRAYAYLSLLFFTLMGLVLWPMGMNPLSNVAVFWLVGQLWSLFLSVYAFWSARRNVAARRYVPNGEMSLGNQNWLWSSESF